MTGTQYSTTILAASLLLTACGSEGVKLDAPAPVIKHDNQIQVREGWLKYAGNISDFANLECHNRGLEIVEEIYLDEVKVSSGIIDDFDYNDEFSLQLTTAHKSYGDMNGDGCDDILLYNDSGMSTLIYDAHSDSFEARNITYQSSNYDNQYLYSDWVAPLLYQHGEIKLQLSDFYNDHVDDLMVLSHDGQDLNIRVIPIESYARNPVVDGRVWDITLIDSMFDVGVNYNRLQGVYLGDFLNPQQPSVITVETLSDHYRLQLFKFDSLGEYARSTKLQLRLNNHYPGEISNVHAVDIDSDGLDELVFISNDFSNYSYPNSRRIYVVDGEQLEL